MNWEVRESIILQSSRREEEAAAQGMALMFRLLYLDLTEIKAVRDVLGSPLGNMGRSEHWNIKLSYTNK